MGEERGRGCLTLNLQQKQEGARPVRKFVGSRASKTMSEELGVTGFSSLDDDCLTIVLRNLRLFDLPRALRS